MFSQNETYFCQVEHSSKLIYSAPTHKHREKTSHGWTLTVELYYCKWHKSIWSAAAVAVVEEGSAMAKVMSFRAERTWVWIWLQIKRQVPMMRTLESNAAPSPSSPITIGVTIQVGHFLVCLFNQLFFKRKRSRVNFGKSWKFLQK